MSAAAGPAGRSVVLARSNAFEPWREAARALLADAVPPERVTWSSEDGTMPTGDLFGEADAAAGEVPAGSGSGPGGGVDRPPVRVPKAFPALAERVLCHRDPGRHAMLYRVLWRIARGERGLLDRASDPDVHRLHLLERAVSREVHKLHAFVRFRRLPGVEPESHVAWIEPEHDTLELAGGFFARRFATMRWSILTPARSLHWDTRTLVVGPGGGRAVVPDDAAIEALWRTYYANVFNPARLATRAMRAEMPVKYWKNLPEASLIGELVRGARSRTDGMLEAAPANVPAFASKALHRRS